MSDFRDAHVGILPVWAALCMCCLFHFTGFKAVLPNSCVTGEGVYVKGPITR